MNEHGNEGRGIFYGVIGVATLVVAIIGATFAYFTATRTNDNEITGNMATVTFGLTTKKVSKADEAKGGMVPMSNNMVEQALSGSDATDTSICVDDSNNAVCQVYKISVENTGSGSIVLDGYVTLSGGSGLATDKGKEATTKTSMRWAQAFCTESDGVLTKCSTIGKSTTGATTDTSTEGIDSDWASIGSQSDTTGLNNENIFLNGRDGFSSVTAAATVNGIASSVISKNYIRISDHVKDASYSNSGDTVDVSSALVFSQQLTASASVDYYIVVWLTENGVDQSASETGENEVAKSAENFFNGLVTFQAAQGSKVTASFTGYTNATNSATTTG